MRNEEVIVDFVSVLQALWKLFFMRGIFWLIIVFPIQNLHYVRSNSSGTLLMEMSRFLLFHSFLVPESLSGLHSSLHYSLILIQQREIIKLIPELDS